VLSKLFGMEHLEWDGYTQVWVEDLDAFLGWYKDPDNVKILGRQLLPNSRIRVKLADCTC